MKAATRKKIQILFLTLLSLIIIGIGISLWLSHHYMEVLQKELPSRVSKATNGVYTASIKDIDINLLTLSAEGEELNLYPDSAYLKHNQPIRNLYNIKIPKVRIGGFNWVKLVFSKKFSSSSLLISGAEIEILQNKNIEDSLWKNADTEQPISSISIGKITVEDIKVRYLSVTDSDTVIIEAQRSLGQLDNWKYYPKKKEMNNGFLYAERGRINITNFHEYKSGELYDTKIGDIKFDSKDSSLSISDLNILPKVDSIAFNRINGHQKDYFKFKMPSIQAAGLDWAKAIDSGMLVMKKLNVKGLHITDYLDRRMPETGASKIGNYPHQLVKKLGIPIYIKQLELDNGYIAYTEFNPETNMSGKISFSKANGSIKNITNIPDSIAIHKETVADLHAVFNDGAATHALFTFYMADSAGAFSVKANMKNITNKELYQPFVALGKVAVNSLNVSNIDAEVYGTDMSAKGSVKMLYTDLKVTIQKKDDNKLKGRWLISFLANKIFLYNNNPEEGETVRTATVQTGRDANRSFFNLIWQTMLLGIQNTVLKTELPTSKK